MFRNGLEPWHIVLVVLVFLVLFGYKKLPDAARGLGKSLRILKSETRALREEGREKSAGYTEKDPPADPPRPPDALHAPTTPAPGHPNPTTTTRPGDGRSGT